MDYPSIGIKYEFLIKSTEYGKKFKEKFKEEKKKDRKTQ